MTGLLNVLSRDAKEGKSFPKYSITLPPLSTYFLSISSNFHNLQFPPCTSHVFYSIPSANPTTLTCRSLHERSSPGSRAAFSTSLCTRNSLSPRHKLTSLHTATRETNPQNGLSFTNSYPELRQPSDQSCPFIHATSSRYHSSSSNILVSLLLPPSCSPP